MRNRFDINIDNPLKWIATAFSLLGLGVLMLALSPVLIWSFIWCWFDDRRKHGL